MSTNDKNVNIENSEFDNVIVTNNKGVITLEISEISIYVCRTVFRSCETSYEKGYGGGIYCSVNTGELSLNQICVSKSKGYEGSFLYAKLPNQITQINNTNTYLCDTKRGILWFTQSIHTTFSYNSSCCKTILHVNFCIEFSPSCLFCYANFYKNQDDILLHIGCDNQYDSSLKYINAIANSKLQLADYGLICCNNNENQVLTVNYGHFFDNNHYLFAPSKGKMILTNIICDIFSYNSESCSINDFINTSIISNTFNIICKINIEEIENYQCQTNFEYQIQQNNEIIHNYNIHEFKYLHATILCFCLSHSSL